MNRVDALKAMLAQDPKNLFARYGLAMEYRNTGALELAVEEFNGLLAVNPNYAAAYFHGAQTLEQLGRLEDARGLYQRGIEVTSKTGDTHTRDELQAALDLLPI